MEAESREIWLKEGDRSTKFFHQMANAYRRRNRMNKVKVNGRWYNEEREIKEEGGVEGLEKPFLEEEVFGALSGCCGEKAPGPDGFSMAFWQFSWEFVKEEVMNFFKQFHEIESFVRSLNATFLVLIPKKGGIEDLKDFRPISLVGGLYKWLAKVLANRMKGVLAKVISTSQNAFVEGRQIIDAVLVANEAIDSIVKSNRRAILCKLDIEKAYDHVGWAFLLAVLEKIGFGEIWCRWIKWVLIHFVMEAFSGLLKRAVVGGFLSPCLIRGRRGEGVQISHLLFVDDTLIFCEAKEDQLLYLCWLLMWFEAISGLRANLKKSELLPVGRVENVDELADEFCYSVGWNRRKIQKEIGYVEIVVRIRLEKIQRGLGVKSLGAFNRALLGKWVWHFANERKALWNQVIRGKYGEERGGWRSCETRKAYGVGLWRVISKMGHLIIPSFGFVVGDASNKEAWVNEVWTTEEERGGSWNPCFNRPFNDWELEEVERLFCCLEGKNVRVDEEDRVIWMESKDGVFLIKSLYRTMQSGSLCFSPFKDYMELLCAA
ncbi:LINE-1 retrotransposable element ORF2 protein [Vitis vinifera]|uniref:LINE-1 retrotransposable element ORF2 protein n=1 Tax=Vitis vinifera TaxID=29760 RepID=A0A438BU99_VITVI|nr:LINE-1 retrotransposable element ORF2 protein [Vitis vinifera]